MFIRLKKKLFITSAPWFSKKYTLDAVLVKSYRKEGKPRQKFIKHLAQIRLEDLSHTIKFKRFWQQVEHQMKTLALDPQIQQNLMEKLQEKIDLLKLM